MNQPDPAKSVVVEATPAHPAAAVAAPKAAPIELGGDEIIQLSVKPSLWFIPLVSLRWLGVTALLAVLLAVLFRQGWTSDAVIALQAVIGVAATRLGIAALQWASRLYLLTNRRVMRFRGVWRVELTECPLAKLSQADLEVSPVQRPLRIGTIYMATATQPTSISWSHIARPAEVHERLLRAIRNSQPRE